MRLGERLHLDWSLTEENLIFLRQLGVEGVIVGLGIPGMEVGSPSETPELLEGDHLEAEGLIRLREKVESFGLDLFALGNLPYRWHYKIIRGLPGRDQQIENWCESLRAMGRAGIPLLKYNWVINESGKLPLWRTSLETPGRGGALMQSFDYQQARDVPGVEYGPITDEEMWERLSYFLMTVIPVAEKAGVRMALHPNDPQAPSLGGIARIIRSPEAYQRVFDLVPSDANAMAFCQGCFAQMLESEDVYEAIRYFGKKDKIAFVHFRNVVGTVDRFAESYWDEGKIDMLKAMQTYEEVGYRGYMVPDHNPKGIGDTKWGHRARAFGLGYIRGLAHAVYGAS